MQNDQDILMKMEDKQTLPNSTAVFIIGLCSVLAITSFLTGVALGIIGIYLSRESRNMFKQNPEQYHKDGMLKAGWIMSIIGLIMGTIYTIYTIVTIVFIGSTVFSIFNTIFK